MRRVAFIAVWWKLTDSLVVTCSCQRNLLMLLLMLLMRLMCVLLAWLCNPCLAWLLLLRWVFFG